MNPYRLNALYRYAENAPSGATIMGVPVAELPDDPALLRGLLESAIESWSRAVGQREREGHIVSVFRGRKI